MATPRHANVKKLSHLKLLLFIKDSCAHATKLKITLTLFLHQSSLLPYHSLMVSGAHVVSRAQRGLGLFSDLFTSAFAKK